VLQQILPPGGQCALQLMDQEDSFGLVSGMYCIHALRGLSAEAHV
jgi:hypothetical protein